jgi:hypothetical protein
MPKQPSAKSTWLLTYGASGPSITHELLRAITDLAVDECYTASDRANKHTIIHLSRKVRQTGMQKAMRAVAASVGIELTTVFGYENINSTHGSVKVKEHVLFRWIVRAHKEMREDFEHWVAPGKTRGVFERFEGLRQKARADPPPPKKTPMRQRLLELTEEVAALRRENEALRHQLEAQ